MWPFSKIKELNQEVERLSELLVKSEAGKIKLEDMQVNNGLHMTLSGSPLHLFADAFHQQFYNSGAVNFLTMDFIHGESGEKFEITMQKVDGESTVEQLGRLKDALIKIHDNSHDRDLVVEVSQDALMIGELL